MSVQAISSGSPAHLFEDGLHACFGHTEVLHFPFVDESLDCASHILHRNLWIDPVLVEEVDVISPQALQ